MNTKCVHQYAAAGISFERNDKDRTINNLVDAGSRKKKQKNWEVEILNAIESKSSLIMENRLVNKKALTTWIKATAEKIQMFQTCVGQKKSPR